MRNLSPGNSQSIHETNVQTLSRFYPDKLIRVKFYPNGTNKYAILPVNYSMASTGHAYRFAFEVGDKAVHYRLANPNFAQTLVPYLNSVWNFDLTTTGIDLTTKVGGLIDGITFANGQIYLLWVFLDEAFNFAGFGVTKRPYSAISAKTNGNKGSTANYTVTNPFQFTNGARVCIRNTVGTQPQYEWNWGQIYNIDTTKIYVLMDNNASYGTNITGVTGAEAIQWSDFRPYVVTSTAQSLYSDYFCLCAEIYTSGAGAVTHVYHVNNFERAIPYTTNSLVVNTAGTVASALFGCARYIPLWAEKAGFKTVSQATSPGQISYVTDSLGFTWAPAITTIGNQLVINDANPVTLTDYARITYYSTANVLSTLQVQCFWVPVGMYN